MSPVFSYKAVKAKGNSRMTEVFKAVKVGSDGFTKTVAMKKLLPQYSNQKALMTTLMLEVQKHSHLNHPNIVQVMDFFRDGEQYCLVLEYVYGMSLENILQICKTEGRMLTWQQSLYVIGEVLKALEYAHTLKDPDGKSLNIIHMNLNPKNVLISFDGHVKVSDFSFSRIRLQTREMFDEITKEGRLSYLSPEVLLNSGITPRSDLFSVGVMLYEMLSMHHPFSQVPPNATLQDVAKMEHETLFSFMPNLDSGIAHLAEHAIQKNPQDRYSQANDYYDHLLEEQDPSWATHGQELFQTLLNELVPKDQRMEDEDLRTLPIVTKQVLGKDKDGIPKGKITEPVSSSVFIRRWLLGAGAVFLILFFVFYKMDPFGLFPKPEPVTPVVAEPAIPALPVLPENRKMITTPHKKMGELSIEGPRGVEIYVNHKKMGVLPMDPITLRPGTYNVSMKHPKKGEKTKFINVVDQQSVQIKW